MMKRKRGVFPSNIVVDKTEIGRGRETSTDIAENGVINIDEKNPPELFMQSTPMIDSVVIDEDHKIYNTNIESIVLSSCSDNDDAATASSKVVSFSNVDNESISTSMGRRTTSTGLILRSSVRQIQKRPHVDDTTSTATVSSAKRTIGFSTAATTKNSCTDVAEKCKTRRSWELWSVEDKKTFFEALCEYGKDFESIQAYVMQKTRKKGSPVQMIKNKDQVRHFYYRTWHKIAKHLHIPDDVKKQTQELYGLINYGELRKKLGGPLDDKNGHKLTELVHQGVTTIRFKGKNLRVKTPVCRALKRLFNIEDAKDGEYRKLPAMIEIDFRPRDNRSWTRVQSVAQNPRLRMSVNPQRRLSTVIDYLQRRWVDPAIKQRKQLLDRVSAEQDGNNKELKPVHFLRVRPRKDATFCNMSLKTTTDLTSSTLSLQNYRQKVLCSDDTVPSIVAALSNCKKIQKGKSLTCSENKKTGLMAVIEDKQQMRDEVCSPTNIKKTRKKIVSNQEKKQEDDEIKDSSSDIKCDAAHDLALRQLLALETAVADPILTKTTDEALFARMPSFLCDTKPLPSSLIPDTGNYIRPSTSVDTGNNVIPATIDKEALLRGWTISECGALTLGEVYLLLDSPTKLFLEYEWECESTMSPDDIKSLEFTKMNNILTQLLTIASSVVADGGKHRLLTNQSTNVSCRCGHQSSCPLSASTYTKLNNSKSSGLIRNSSTARGILKTPKASNTQKVPVLKSISPKDALNVSTERLPTVTSHVTNATQNTTEIFRKPISSPTQNKSIKASKNPSSFSIVSSSSTTSGNEKQSTDDRAFKEQLYKYRRTKGRSGNSMVVQRELLPKVTPAHSMMTLSIIPSASQLAGSFMPVIASRTIPLTKVMPLSQPAVTAAPSSAAKIIRVSSMPEAPTLTLPIATLAPTLALPIATLAQTSTSSLQPRLVTASPCTILIRNEKLSKTLDNNSVPLLTTVSTGTSFTDRLSSMSTFPSTTVVATTVATALHGLTSFPISNLNLETGLNSSSINGGRFSSIPIMSVAESNMHSNLAVSPPTISSLLDMSLTGTDTLPLTEVNLDSDISTDKMIGNSNSFTGLIDSTLIGKCAVRSNNVDNMVTSNPCLGGSICLDPQRPSTPLNSPTNSLFKICSPGLENNWFNGDTNDFSLSNLLSHLESPIKVSASLQASTGIHSEGIDAITRLAPDMDSQFRSLISESSIDYIAKFEDLAAQIGNK